MRFSTPLPIDPHLDALFAQVQAQPVTLIQAPPGTGKTVHLPLRLLELGRVWVLEPRRVAARLAAQFAAREFAHEGQAVGYHFRNERQVTSQTRCTYLTEGMLLRLAQSDPELCAVQVVILDEFHERHASTDIAWAYLRRLQQTVRPDLKIVILSATLDVATLSAQIPGLAPVSIPLNHHALTVHYRPEFSVLEGVREAHMLLKKAETPGSILVFLAGRRDIDREKQALQDAVSLPIEVLHGGLDAKEQARVVAPGREPRVILSTNLAESSITIDGVRAVVDAGDYRQPHANPWTGIPTLRTRAITRASAVQRAGRAARQGPGLVVRLYSQGDFQTFFPFESPELLRSDLSPIYLDCLGLGISDAACLPWLDAPPAGTWAVAREQLENFGFLDQGKLTPDGEMARRFPTAPRVARLLIDASRATDAAVRGRLEDLAVGISLEALPAGDCSRLTLPNTFAVREERKRLLEASPQSSVGDTQSFYSALLRACGDHVARLKSTDPRGATYLTASGSEVWMPVAGGGAGAAQWILALLVTESQLGEARRIPQIRAWLPFEEDDLLEAPARFWNDAVVYKWEPDRQTFVTLAQSRFGQILLSETRRFPEPGRELGAQLADKYISLAFAHADSRMWLESTWVRLRTAGLVPPDAHPWEGEGSLRALIAPLAETWSSLKDAPTYDENNALDLAESMALNLGDSRAVGRLRKLAPRALALSRRQAPITYSLTEAPRCESRLQDFLGMRETPRVGEPPQPLTLILLAPNYRPVQVTQDLASFWRGTYQEIRRDLMRRYPRHAWPEDPLKLE